MTRKLTSHTAVLHEYLRDPETWGWATKIASRHTLNKICSPSPLATMVYLAAGEGGFARQYCATFLDYLKNGTGLSVGDPILTYRNKVMANPAGRQGQARLADYIKLFNAHATGQKLKVFKVQAFPPMPTLVTAEESIHDDAAA